MSVFGEENYKEQIKEAAKLINESKNDEGLDILDSINFKKIYNISTIVYASELYEKAGKPDQAKSILVMAHERSPIGRIILFHLCLLCLRKGEIEEGKEYYDEFIRIAPDDLKKYVLKYHLAKRKGADEYTLISILEELKNYELIDEWGYQLAFLYHKTGQIDKCVDLCDEVALYYGEGIFVEKALELKMLYRPLTSEQEEQYRKISGISIKKPDNNDDYSIEATRDIPAPVKQYDNFDTVNLQTEIRKNIDEIMNATEKVEVDQNLGNIEELVGEFPYLKMGEKEYKDKNSKKEKEKEDETIMANYKHFLDEEYDGQLSLYIPEKPEVEPQIEGQLTIDDVLKDWNKTSRAAKAAIQESEKEKFEKTKESALKKANHIMNRLEEAMPLIDAGAKPNELAKDFVLSNKNESEDEKSKVSGDKFAIPKISEDGKDSGVGMEIPVVTKEQSKEPVLEPEKKEEKEKIVKNWTPPTLNEAIKNNPTPKGKVSFKDVVAIMSDVNDILQKEIEEQEDNSEKDDLKNEADREAKKRAKAEIENVLEKINLSGESEDSQLEEEKPIMSTIDMKPDDESLLAETIANIKNENEKQKKESLSKDKNSIQDIKENLDKTIVFEALDNNNASVSNVLDNFDKDENDNEIEESYDMELTAEEKENFSYFLPAPNMEKSIIKVLTGVKERLLKGGVSNSGNILIVGGHGSGKTTLAKALIMTLQEQIDKPGSNIGKIDADKLIGKDIQELYRKIKGGCLVIEQAGDMDKESAISLELMMNSDKSGTLIILEDTEAGIKRALSLYNQFSKKFTEKIEIPVFSIDELVKFGVRYANDSGYSIDEIGKLAMYDRISKTQSLSKNLYFIDIIEIVNEAISRSRNKGFFRRRKVDEEGRPLLTEKDFL